jgi:hypothetical protein
VTVEGIGRPERPGWKKRRESRGSIFVHKEKAFAEYNKGIQELISKEAVNDDSH